MKPQDTEKSRNFTEVQHEFTRHMRDPEKFPAPADIEDRRLGIYRDLLYRNVESFMSDSFPVLREITDDRNWHKMIRDYFSRHKATTPLFPKMPQEFLKYLADERVYTSEDYPFIRELAHYEWIEMALAFDTREIFLDAVDPDGDLLNGRPALSPLAWPLTYSYPVHRIGPEYLPAEIPEDKTYLVVYRDRSDEIGFLELNPVSARLLELIEQNQDTIARELLNQIAVELNHPQPEVVIKGGGEILENMAARDIILGTRLQAST